MLFLADRHDPGCNVDHLHAVLMLVAVLTAGFGAGEKINSVGMEKQLTVGFRLVGHGCHSCAKGQGSPRSRSNAPRPSSYTRRTASMGLWLGFKPRMMRIRCIWFSTPDIARHGIEQFSRRHSPGNSARGTWQIEQMVVLRSLSTTHLPNVRSDTQPNRRSPVDLRDLDAALALGSTNALEQFLCDR